MLKYRCELCLRVFISTRAETDALAEYARHFPNDDPCDKSIVCNSCGDLLIAWELAGRPTLSSKHALKRLLEQYSERQDTK